MAAPHKFFTKEMDDKLDAAVGRGRYARPKRGDLGDAEVFFQRLHLLFFADMRMACPLQ